MRTEGGKLVRRGPEWIARLLLKLLRRQVSKPRVRVESRTDSRASDRHVVEASFCVLHFPESKVQLRHPSPDLLAERDWRCVLEVGGSGQP